MHSIVHRIPGSLEPGESEHLYGLLDRVADDFVPSLHRRSGTTVDVLDSDTADDGQAYFHEMLAQDNLLLVDDGDLAAFMSFKARYVVPRLPNLGEVIYVSTIAVSPDSRNHGLARTLYEALFDLPDDYPEMVTLRTWSTNASHIGLITKKLGFTLLDTIPDHRGAGVDTVYYGHMRDAR